MTKGTRRSGSTNMENSSNIALEVRMGRVKQALERITRQNERSIATIDRINNICINLEDTTLDIAPLRKKMARIETDHIEKYKELKQTINNVDTKHF